MISSSRCNIDDAQSKSPGNYLISHEGLPLYIGESLDIKKRLKEQFGSSSTFYKNYLQKKSTIDIPINLELLDFQMKFIETKIGRKEVEEFGIVNLETSLNKFQLGKKDKVILDVPPRIWEVMQNQASAIISDGTKLISDETATTWYEAKLPSLAGLYHITHSTDGLIYIGESTNIYARWKTHGTDTRFSALRRHIGTDLLHFQLKTKSELGLVINAKKDKRMYLNDQEDLLVNKYLTNCTIKFLPIRYGRMELEEHLIRSLQPMLNRKSKG
jgi:predicted GIY-YIG superfamily endonuclease